MELYRKYRDRTIEDYGDEPVISKFFDDTFAKIYQEIDAKHLAFQDRYKDAFDRVCDFTERVRTSPPAHGGTRLQLVELLKEVEELLIYQMNQEILEAIERLHHRKFCRPFMKLLWEKKTAESAFKDFFLHGVVRGLSRHLNYLVNEFGAKWGLDLRPPLAVSTENLGGTQTTLPDAISVEAARLPEGKGSSEFQATLDAIRKEVQDQANLIGTHQMFLDSFIKRLPARYTCRGVLPALLPGLPAGLGLQPGGLLPAPVRAAPGPGHPRAGRGGLHEPHGHHHRVRVPLPADLRLLGLAVSAYLYTQYFNINASISGAIQAIALASLIFLLIWSRYIKFATYKTPFLIWIAFSAVGNLLYYLAEMKTDFDDKSVNVHGIIILIFGRILMGIGSARLSTRKYLAMTIKPWAQTKYSSFFVATVSAAFCIGGGFRPSFTTRTSRTTSAFRWPAPRCATTTCWRSSTS